MRETDLSFSFSSVLTNWYKQNKRELPWRQTSNPYYIWLSEIILQQTRVEQGLPYYQRFVEYYPQIELLARASEDEVFKLWQGLGYYSRARNLHYTAKDVVDRFGGVFPSDYKTVLSLKGVGEYTAAAIMSFSFNAPYATVDGNVFRVLSRIYGVKEYIDTLQGKRIFSELAAEVLDKDQPGLHNQAIMDFGALLCTPKLPKCEDCPFINKCFAYNNNVIDSLPRKVGRVKKRNRYLNYLDVCVEGDRFIWKREPGDVWAGLYEFPLIETGCEMTFEELARTKEYKELFSSTAKIDIVKQVEFKHILSHQNIYAKFYRLEVDRFRSQKYIKVKQQKIDEYGVSRLVDRYLSE